jgi:hypothetical protein
MTPNLWDARISRSAHDCRLELSDGLPPALCRYEAPPLMKSNGNSARQCPQMHRPTTESLSGSSGRELNTLKLKSVHVSVFLCGRPLCVSFIALRMEFPCPEQNVIQFSHSIPARFNKIIVFHRKYTARPCYSIVGM